MIVGPKIGTQVAVGDEALLVGRDPSCSLHIDSDLVSRKHARVERGPGGVRAIDLRSTNGTFVNDQRITTADLHDGDRLGVGSIVFKFFESGNLEAQYHQELYRLMTFDGLTNIHNKRYYDEALTAELQRTASASLSVIVFDVDHFKRINDTYGHAAGDSVLRSLAALAKANVPPGATFGRVGGEEFSIILPGYNLEQAVWVAQNVRSSVESNRFCFDDTVIPVTVSVGAAERPPGSRESGSALYQRADQELYRAKQSGRNRVCAGGAS